MNPQSILKFRSAFLVILHSISYIVMVCSGYYIHGVDCINRIPPVLTAIVDINILKILSKISCRYRERRNGSNENAKYLSS